MSLYPRGVYADLMVWAGIHPLQAVLVTMAAGAIAAWMFVLVRSVAKAARVIRESRMVADDSFEAHVRAALDIIADPDGPCYDAVIEFNRNRRKGTRYRSPIDSVMSGFAGSGHITTNRDEAES